jgi:hypothetical protein
MSEAHIRRKRSHDDRASKNIPSMCDSKDAPYYVIAATTTLDQLKRSIEEQAEKFALCRNCSKALRNLNG